MARAVDDAICNQPDRGLRCMPLFIAVIIGLDFDDTYTADKALWDAFIAVAKQRGHRVWIVTARRNTTENQELLDRLGPEDVPVAFTNLSPKPWYMEKTYNVKVDIWIDDNPKALVHGH